MFQQNNILFTNDTDCYTPCNFNFFFDIKKVSCIFLLQSMSLAVLLSYTFAHVLSRMKQLEGWSWWQSFIVLRDSEVSKNCAAQYIHPDNKLSHSLYRKIIITGAFFISNAWRPISTQRSNPSHPKRLLISEHLRWNGL